MLEHSQHCDLVAGQKPSTMPIIMPAPPSAWNLYGDPRLVTIRRVNIPNSSFSKCDMCPYFGGVEESQVNQDSLFEGGRPHIGWPHWLQDFRESCVKCDFWVRDQRGSLLESHQARTHHHLSGGYLCLPWWRTCARELAEGGCWQVPRSFLASHCAPPHEQQLPAIPSAGCKRRRWGYWGLLPGGGAYQQHEGVRIVCCWWRRLFLLPLWNGFPFNSGKNCALIHRAFQAGRPHFH